MEPNKDTPTPNTNETPKVEPQAPVDALSRTPDDLEQERVAQASANQTAIPTEKKRSKFVQFLRRINVYFLTFVLMVVVACVIMIVQYLNSQKVAPEPEVASQSLTESALKELANKDATVGSSSQTLTIQGNAIIAGQTLTRGNLNVAGNFQTGGSIQGPRLTISGEANLGATQVNSLQVASNAAVQGNTSLRDVSVSGSASFSGPLSASQITTSRLILSGNAVLQVPNHVSFNGPSPGRSVNSGVLGSGGSASVNGSDTSGTININTGGGTQAGCFAQISFAQAFSGQPRVIVSPVGAAASRTDYYTERSSTGFSICTSTPAPANQAFAFDYFVAG